MKPLEMRPGLKGFLLGIPMVFLTWEAYGVILASTLFLHSSDRMSRDIGLLLLFWAALLLVLLYFNAKGFPLAAGFLFATPIAFLVYLANGLARFYIAIHSTCP